MSMLPRRLLGFGLTASLLVGGIFLAIYFLGSQEPAEIREARQAIERREFATALEILDRRLKSHPDDPKALVLAAETARRAFQPGRADRYLRNLEKLGGHREDVAREERLGRLQSGETELAEEALRECEQRPGAAENHLTLEAIVLGALPPLDAIEAAQGKIQEGPDLHRAMRAADALLQCPLSPADRVEALFWSGRIHRICLRHTRGLEDLRKAVELDPRHFEVRMYLARTISQAQPDEALSHLQVLSELKPGDTGILFSLAALHRALGHTAEAARILDGLMAENPGNPQLLLERAHVYMDTGKSMEAEVLLRQAYARRGEDRDIMLALVKCLRVQGRTEDADLLFQRIRELEERFKRKKENPKP